MRYRIGRWLFLRGIALTYLVAFVSLWVQVDGLIGSNGILPIGEFLDNVHGRFGSDAYRLLPTLTWFSHSDAFLHLLCGCGVAFSLLLMVGFAPIPLLVALWATYLSLQISGQVFLGFQWDILLLESGFCAIFFAPARLRPRLPWNEPPPHPAGRFLLWLLLFKLMVLSGAVKLISLDDTWWELTALDYHYFTTPLPLWTGWYAHHFPAWMQKTSILVTYLIEIGLPFLFFGPRRLRHAAAIAELFLQLVIAGTGNYGFFNLLTAVLCIPLFDDAFLERLLPVGYRGLGPTSLEPPVSARRRALFRYAPAVLAGVLVFFSALSFVREVVRTAPRQGIDGFCGSVIEAGDRWILSWGGSALGWIDPFHTINGYGLFRAMTTARPEIVIEASSDGVAWREYEFRWKPGDVGGRPRLAAPHMPRLDWQMWFAALNPPRHNGWMRRLVMRLLEGSPEVEGLLESVPFADSPPRFIRLAYYDYEFTTPVEGRVTGDWWRRTRRGELTGPVTLEAFGR